MANFWDNDEPVEEFWSGDTPVYTPRKRPVTIDAVEPPSFMEAVKDRVVEIGRDTLETREALGKTIPAAAKNMAAGVGRGLADLSSGMQSAAAESYAGYETDDPQVQAQQQAAAQAAEDRAFQSDLRSGSTGRAARRAAIEGEEAIPADAGPIQKAAIQGLTSAAIATPAILAGGPVGGAAVLGAGTAGSRYTELIDKGIPRPVAAKSAMMMGSLEGLTEFLPGKALVKNTPEFWKRFAEFMVSELPGENINSIAQILDDYRLELRDDVTKDDILQAVQETTLATLIGGGAQTGAAQLIQQAIERANQAKQPPIAFDMEMPQPAVALPSPAPFVPPATDFIVNEQGEAFRQGEDQIQVQEAEDVALEGGTPPELSEPPPSVEVQEAEEVTLEGDGEMLPGEIRVEETPSEEIAYDRESESVPGTGVRVEDGTGTEAMGRGDGVGTQPPAIEAPPQTSEADPSSDGGALDVQALKALKEGTAGQDQLDRLVQAGLANTEGKLLPAGRRALRTVQQKAIQAAAKLGGPKTRVTVTKDGDVWRLAINGKEGASYLSEKLAREDAVAARQALAGKATVLGQEISFPADPTPAMATEGNYRKPTVTWNGLTIKIENLEGSERRGIGADGQPWQRTMKGTYGYIGQSKAKDGDAVDVFVGDDANADTVYVVDQLKPSGRTYDEAKVVIGASSQEAAEKLYRSNYPANWKGLGAITPMTVEEFKRWVQSRSATEPVRWKQTEPEHNPVYQRNEEGKKASSRPSIDHSILSPNGRMSKAARAAALKAEHDRLFPPGFWDAPAKSAIEQALEKAKRLRRSAKDLRDLAAKGMSVKKFSKAAEQLEKEAAALEEGAALQNDSGNDSNSPDVTAQRGAESGKLSEREVRAKINRLLRGFKARPPLSVVQSVDQLPASVPDIPDDVRAFMFNGRFYAIADRVPSLDALADTVQHEVTIHFGLRSVLSPEQRAEILEGITRDNPMEVRRRGRQEFGETFDFTDDFQRHRAAEEVLAYYGGKYLEGESLPERIKRWVEKLFAMVRDWARNARGQDRKYDNTWMKGFVQDLQEHLKKGTAEPAQPEPEMAAQRAVPTFYSALTRAVETSKTARAPAAQWLSTLRNSHGVKPEEIEWSGVEEWLQSIGRPVTREELTDFLRANEIQVQDVLRGGESQNALQREHDQIVVELTAKGYSPDSYDPDNGFAIETNSGDRWIFDEREGLWRGTRDETRPFPDEILDMADRMVEIRQYMLDGPEDFAQDNETRYSTYTTPGGENYRELLLTLPEPPRVWLDGSPVTKDDVSTPHGREAARRVASYVDIEPYQSSHWSEPNILAHVRFNERTDADGKRVLFIEEIQSDWHQAGRKRGYKEPVQPITIASVEEDEDSFKVVFSNGITSQVGKAILKGYKSVDESGVRAYYTSILKEMNTAAKEAQYNRVPDAPFKTTWPELAFKRMIRWAAENGFERIAWLPGRAQADRYSLSKHISVIEARKKYEDSYELKVFDKGDQQISMAGLRDMSHADMVSMFGEGIAQRIVSELEGKDEIELSGLDLEVGGEGMVGFYDQVLPAAVNKMVKKWGAKVGTTRIQTVPDADAAIIEENVRRVHGASGQAFDEAMARLSSNVHAVDVTDSMRSAALEGLPLFQRNQPAVNATQAKPDEQSGYRALAQRALDAWNEKVGWRWGPLGRLPEKDNYLRLRYRTLGNLTEVRDIARGVFDTMRESTPEDRKAAFEYLTTRNARADAIQDEKIRSTAQRVKELFDIQGQRLVDAGLIPQESFDAYAGQYLPRLYLKHILGDKLHAMMGTGKRTSDLGQTKHRDPDLPEEVRKVILGEIQDPAFLASFGLSRTMRDMAMIDFLEAVSKNEAWTPPAMLVEWRGKKVSPFWMHSEAVRMRKQADFMQEHALAKKAREMADQMDTLANQAIARLEKANLDGFKQIPDSAQYGALRGLWVREEIYEDLVGAQNFIEPGTVEAWIQKWGGKLTRGWKTSKVALNPPSHFRNMMGNSIMLQLSGLPFRRQGMRLVQAINSLREKDKYYEIAKKYGMYEATFSNIELARIADEWISMQDSKVGHFGKINAIAGRFTNAIGDVYQFEEALFKLMKLRDNMENGMDEATAMIDAHKWVFDYSLVPRWVRFMRNAPLGTPFLTYTYKAIPRMAEVLVKHPHRYLPYIAAAYALQEVLEHAFDVDDDDLEKLKKAYPEWTQTKGGLMLLPFRDDNGNLQLFDMGYIVPWGMLADLTRQGQELEGGMMLDSMGVMSGPIADLISAWQTGIDPFTRKPIVDERDTPKEQMKQRLWYAYSLAAPGWLTPQGFSGKLYDHLSGAVDKRTGEPKLTGGQVTGRFFGLTVYPVNPTESRQTNLYFMQKDIEDIRFRRNQRLRDKNLDSEERKKLRSEFKEWIDRKSDELRQYRKESEVHPNLRNQNVEEKVGFLIDGKRKPEAVKALREAGYPAFAALIEDMPVRPRPVVAKALQEIRSHA